MAVDDASAEHTAYDSAPDGDIATVLGELGAALLDAGYAVTDVAQTLRTVGKTRGRTDLTIGVLPSAIMVDDPVARRMRLVNATGAALTFDQVAEVAAIARSAELTPLPDTTLCDRIAAVRTRRPRFPRAVAVLGSGLQSAGIAVVFRTTWWAVLLDFVLALLVGAALMFGSRVAGLAAVLPFLLTFAVSLVVYGLAVDLQLGAITLFAVCAPLVILIPGATITTGVVELTAGDVVSGGGRFVSGLIMWATLAVGIAAGAAVVGVPATSQESATAVPGWAMVPAVIVLGIGVGLFFDASWSLMAVLVMVLLVTFGVVTAAQLVAAGPVASGIAAAVMLPALRLLEVYRPRWPAAVTFRPAFWLLVPGSLGLIAISELATSGQPDAQALLGDVIATVLAISLGVQIGAVVSALIRPRAEEPYPEAG
ncbi:MAG: threonine/serine exporter family protein [Nakamurella sp.]